MPIVNGRVHVDRRRMPGHHRAAYIGGIALAVGIVACGWALTVGTQLRSFVDGAKEGMIAASETLAKAQANAAASVPKVPLPDLAAALRPAIAEDVSARSLPVADPVDAEQTEAPADDSTPNSETP